MICKQFEMISIPERQAKPRENGLTLMLDKGLAARGVEDVLDVSADYIDLVKFGWGTAVITPDLERKLAIYREAGIPVFFGGTLFEAFVLRGQLDTYRHLLSSMKLEHVEVSDGSLDMAHEDKLAAIELLAQDFTVLSEVGSKDADKIMPPYKWVNLIKAELAAGSWKVICEARETGTAGLFRPNGEVRSGLVEEIIDHVGSNHVLFEAPKKPQQVWFIRLLGSNANLGNISPEEVLPLETLRLGLRADTLFEFLEKGA